LIAFKKHQRSGVQVPEIRLLVLFKG